jgi:hypothetical protein
LPCNRILPNPATEHPRATARINLNAVVQREVTVDYVGSFVAW